MTKDEMIDCFESAPMGSRHERMLWAARKISDLAGTTEGGAYQMLLIALIEAEGRLDLKWLGTSGGQQRMVSRSVSRPDARAT